MKQKFIALMIAVAAAFASAQSEPALAKPAPREHRGFYSSVSFGAAYNWYNSSKQEFDEWQNGDDDDVHTRRMLDKFEYYGGTFPTLELKFGTAFANLLAVHSVFNFGFYAGAMDYFYEQDNKDCAAEASCKYVPEKDEYEESSSDGYSFRTFIGLGVTVYPFRDKESPLNGFFIGGAYGYGMVAAMIVSGYEESCVNFGNSFQVEIGKEWWVNDHLSVGLGIGFAHTNLVWQTVDSHSSDNVISISIRLTRG